MRGVAQDVVVGAVERFQADLSVAQLLGAVGQVEGGEIGEAGPDAALSVGGEEGGELGEAVVRLRLRADGALFGVVRFEAAEGFGAWWDGGAGGCCCLRGELG